jgi:DNA-directed RNA polymerase specialized sigma24 family protein
LTTSLHYETKDVMAKPRGPAHEITERLDTIIRLLAGSIGIGRPQRERIALLSGAGLPPREIAQVLGTTSNTVRVALAGIRRRPQRKGGGRA